MRSKVLGFSLIEILFVLALLGLISSVCVLHFDSIQMAFSGGNPHPKALLEEVIQQGRLSAHQLHQTMSISVDEKGFVLKKGDDQVLQSFAFPKQAFEVQCKFISGTLSPEGGFKPSQNPCAAMVINEEGFIASTFIEITYGEDHEKYEIDMLTGELRTAQW